MAMQAAILAWSDHLAQNRRRSAHTVRAYVATAHRLVAFLTGHWGEAISAERLAKTSAADLRAYLAFRRAEGLGNASAARELSAVRGFLTFSGGEGATPRLKGPRVKKGIPRPISPDEVVSLAEDVAENAAEPWIGARDWAVLLLLYGAGLRIGEAAGLTGAILPLGATLSVTGKRAKTRIVPLLPQVREAIEAYAALCPWPIERSEALFRGAKGGRARSRADPPRGAGGTNPARPVRPHHPPCPAPQLRYASAWARRGSARAAGVARPCQPQFDPDLHRRRCGASARCLSQRASSGMMSIN